MKFNFLFREKLRLLEDDSNQHPIPCTIVDILVVDENGSPIPDARITLFYKDKEITTSNFKFIKTDSEGEYKNIMVDSDESTFIKTDKNKLQTLETNFAKCDRKEKLQIEVKHKKNKKLFTQTICLNNGYLYNSNPDETFRFKSLPESNKLMLTLPPLPPKPEPKPKSEPGPIPCTVVDVLVVDEENNPVKNVRLKLFFEENEIATSNFRFIKTDSNGEFNNIMIDSGESVFMPSDKNKLETLKRNFANCSRKGVLKIETKYKRNKKTFSQNVCINNAYVYNSNPDETFRFDTLPNSNKLKIVLSKPLPEPVVEPEPEVEIEKDYDFGGCTKITRKLYRQMREIVLGNREMENLDTNEVVKLRTAVEKCVHKYYKQYEKEKPNFEKKVISSLMNVTPEMKIFELRFTPTQIRDIYGESRTMSLNNTIRKVIFESSEKKNLLKEEKKLIKNRFLFSINDLNLNNRRQFNESKKRLNNETINLIRRGYNQRLVKETLLDVMQSLYGADGTNVITDFKTKLGEKIATQVKNKEEEHNMILSAFNDLPEDMVERAIKENRVDELSSEIATRAMEMYKGQYGTEGLSGLMFASVDENKFKQEVAKLLEPAINDITTKMDEKFKEIQNAVGGITKTA